jgi:hypothetical protein
MTRAVNGLIKRIRVAAPGITVLLLKTQPELRKHTICELVGLRAGVPRTLQTRLPQRTRSATMLEYRTERASDDLEVPEIARRAGVHATIVNVR